MSPQNILRLHADNIFAGSEAQDVLHALEVLATLHETGADSLLCGIRSGRRNLLEAEASVLGKGACDPLSLPDSLQTRILFMVSEGDPGHAIWNEWEVAKRSARMRLLDLGCRVALGMGFDKAAPLLRAEIDPFDRSRARRGIEIPTVLPEIHGRLRDQLNDLQTARRGAILNLLFPVGEDILKDRLFRKIADQELRAGRGLELAEAMRWAKERKPDSPFGITAWHLRLALHWVNPDLPLWLATDKATVTATATTTNGMRHLVFGEGVDINALSQERRRSGLTKGSVMPIKGIRENKVAGGFDLTIKICSIEWEEKL